MEVIPGFVLQLNKQWYCSSKCNNEKKIIPDNVQTRPNMFKQVWRRPTSRLLFIIIIFCLENFYCVLRLINLNYNEKSTFKFIGDLFQVICNDGHFVNQSIEYSKKGHFAPTRKEEERVEWK